MSLFLRRVLLALGIFAALNLVAIALLLGWLLMTGRMDGERFQSLRDRIVTPIAAQRDAEARSIAASHEAEALEIERVRLGIAPRSSADRAAEVDRALDQAQLRRRLVEEEARLLGRSLDERLAAINAKELTVAQDAKQHADQVATEQSLRSDAQFKKTVQLLEAAPSRQAKDWLLEMTRTGRTSDAVRYLDAMSNFSASRVLRELKSTEETTLAADLLEALRRRSLDAGNSDP